MDDFWSSREVAVVEVPPVPGPMVIDALLDARNGCEVAEMVAVIDELLVRVSSRGTVSPDEAKVIAFQLGAAERQFVEARPPIRVRRRLRAAAPTAPPMHTTRLEADSSRTS